MLELKGWLEEHYTLTECVLCTEPVIKVKKIIEKENSLKIPKGQTCSNAKCGVRMHFHCSKEWYSKKKDKKCPTCTNPWTDF